MSRLHYLAAISIVLVILFACTPTAAPTLSPEQLRAKWQSPLLVSFLTYGLCQQAQEQEPNAMAMALLLGIMKKGLDEWTPADDQAEIDKALREQINGLGEAITAGDSAGATKEACSQAETVMKDIRARANGDGMSDEEIKKIIEEYQEKLKQ